MRRITFIGIGLILILGLGTLATARSQERLDGIAAIVGDQIILRSEVSQYAFNLALQMNLDIKKDPQKFESLQKQTLQNLIIQKILLEKAKEDTIKVDDAQVDQMLDQQITAWTRQVGSEAKLEEYFGMPINKIRREFRDEVRNRLLVEKVQQQFMQKVTITRPEVEEFYRTMKDSLPEMREMVNISHILMQIKARGKAREEALKKIREIRQKILNGADFAAMARLYSEDPGSANRGGELGFIQRGDFVPEFEKVAFSLSPGEISDVVETRFGFHIIQLIERRGEKINVRHILIRLKPTEKDAELTRKLLAAVRDSILHGASFEEMAKKYSDDQTTKDNGGNLGWFEVDKLQMPEFKEAIKNLKPGEISEPFRTQYGYHIVKLNAKREAGKLTLDRDWQQIEQMALNYKRSKKFKEWVDTLRKQTYIDIKE